MNRRPWTCPLCGTKYRIPIKARDPDLCPRCRDEPAPTRPQYVVAAIASVAALFVYAMLFMLVFGVNPLSDSVAGWIGACVVVGGMWTLLTTKPWRK